MTPTATQNTAQLFTVASAATMLNLSQRTVHRLIATRRIRASRIGTSIRIAPAEMDKFIKGLPVR